MNEVNLILSGHNNPRVDFQFRITGKKNPMDHYDPSVNFLSMMYSNCRRTGSFGMTIRTKST